MSPYRLHSNFSSRTLVSGAVAGFVATIPMTASMLLGRRFFLRHKEILLPPQKITEEFAERLDLEYQMGPKERDIAALFLHFSYGALSGAGYGLIEPGFPLPASIKGTLAGLALWAGSYLGWLPATGILRPAARHPLRLNILMIIAHLIWGITVGMVFRKLNSN